MPPILSAGDSSRLSERAAAVMRKAADVRLDRDGADGGPIALGHAKRDLSAREIKQRNRVYRHLFGLPEADCRDLAVVLGTWPGSQRAALVAAAGDEEAALRDRALATEPDLVAAEGDLVAAVVLFALLSLVYEDRQIQLCVVSRDDEEEYAAAKRQCEGRHLFLVGGPVINKITADVLAQTGASLPFESTGTGFGEASHGLSAGTKVRSFEVGFDAIGKQPVDYSMLLKVPLCGADGPLAFVFMGARQYATCGAVAALRDDTWLACVVPKVIGKDRFQLICRHVSGVSDPWPVSGSFATDVLPLREDA